jgi:hypothetical protein
VGFDIGKAKASEPREEFIPNPKLKLLDQLSEVMRLKHYSLRTEQTYREWIKRFIFFHGKRHSRDLGTFQVERFLSDLSVTRKVVASTQNQASNEEAGFDAECLHSAFCIVGYFEVWGIVREQSGATRVIHAKSVSGAALALYNAQNAGSGAGFCLRPAY